MERKLYDLAKEHSLNNRFHMPGHKGKLPNIDSRVDITELSFSDNMLDPCGAIKNINDKIKKVYQVKYASVLTCGGTSGIFAMLHCYKNKKLLISRNSHKSVFNALEVLNIDYELIGNVISLDSVTLDINELEIKIKHFDGVMLTYPNYYGEVFDIEKVRQILKNKLLLIDGTHASHFVYSDIFPTCPAKHADMCVLSLHKTSGALTQSAVILSNDINPIKSINIFHSTSPSYILMSSIEMSLEYMEQNCHEFALKLLKATPRSDGGDIFKYVYDASTLGYSGVELASILEKRGIYCEMYDYKKVVFIITCYDDISDVNNLINELSTIKNGDSYIDLSFNVVPIKSRLNNYENMCKVDIAMAVGKTCANDIGLYPPGVPLLKKGEIITKEIVEIFKRFNHAFGVNNGYIEVINER